MQARARDVEAHDDMVMVDAEQSPHGPEVFSGPDDLAFVEAPPRERHHRRSSNVPKKAESGGFRSLFGSLRKPSRPEPPERHRSRSYRDDDAKHMTDIEKEEARRIRHEERRKRRSMRPETDVEGFTTDAGPPVGADTEPEDVEARRADREAKRSSRYASDLRESEERRARRREERETREKRAREEEEREEERRRQEKRARRAAREERRAREEREAREAEARAEARAAERRERRRTREMEEVNGVSRHRSKSGRRRSYAPERAPERYSQDDNTGERHHRSHRSGDEGGRSKRRRSTARDPAQFYPVMSGGKDKTSSWVHSQATDPPEPPPIVATVVDVPQGVDAQNGHSLSSDEEARREMRRLAKRRAKYPGLTDDEIAERRARRREARRAERDGIKSSSGSGDYERERGSRAYDSRYYVPPASGTKRTSWFRRLTTL